MAGDVFIPKASEADRPVIRRAPIGGISITWREDRVRCIAAATTGETGLRAALPYERSVTCPYSLPLGEPRPELAK